MRRVVITSLAGLLLVAFGCGKSADKKAEPGDKPAADRPGDTPAHKPGDGPGDKPDKPAASSNDIKRYQIKSGVLEYAVSGAQTGTETLTFDDWGWNEATHTQVELDVMGHKSKENSMALISREYTHTFDVEKRTGLRVADPTGVLIERAKEAGQDMTDLGTAMLTSMGGTKTGTKTVAGHECDVYEVKSLGTTTCLYKGLTLESKTTMANMTINKVATKAEFDVAVPAETFAVPTDVKFREIESPLARPKK